MCVCATVQLCNCASEWGTAGSNCDLCASLSVKELTEEFDRLSTAVVTMSNTRVAEPSGSTIAEEASTPAAEADTGASPFGSVDDVMAKLDLMGVSSSVDRTLVADVHRNFEGHVQKTVESICAFLGL